AVHAVDAERRAQLPGRLWRRYATTSLYAGPVNCSSVPVAGVGLQVADHQRASLERRQQLAFDHLSRRQAGASIRDECFLVGASHVDVVLTSGIVRLVIHDILLFAADWRGTQLNPRSSRSCDSCELDNTSLPGSMYSRQRVSPLNGSLPRSPPARG